MGRAKAGERVVDTGVALLHGRPVQDPSLAVADRFVDHDVAGGVAVREHDPRVVGRPCDNERAVLALPEGLGSTRRQLDANGRDQGLLARLDGEVGDAGGVVDLDEVRTTAGE